MTDPITPPPELRCQWQSESPFRVISVEREDYMIDRAAQWGADQELKACCEWLGDDDRAAIRAARRPKPPSLKERALQAWAAVEAGTDDQTAMAVIRRALEELPE